jgi:hypothetical protein
MNFGGSWEQMDPSVLSLKTPVIWTNFEPVVKDENIKSFALVPREAWLGLRQTPDRRIAGVLEGGVVRPVGAVRRSSADLGRRF